MVPQAEIDNLGLEVVPLSIISDHPKLVEMSPTGILEWNAHAQTLEEILLLHGAMPLLKGLPKVAERHVDLFEDSKVIADGEVVASESRTSRRLILNPCRVPEEIVFFSMLCESIEPQLVRLYRQFVNPFAEVSGKSTGYELLRYAPGEKFSTHVDRVYANEPSDSPSPVSAHDVVSVNSPAMRRLSVIAYCNDNFEGGKLRFPRQGIEITPKPGLVVVFPSGFTHPHAALPVSSGIRYCVVTWFC